MEPFVDDRRGVEFGGGFQNHNVEKLGITLNLRTDRGRELLARARAHLRRRHRELRRRRARATSGFPYERLREIRDDVIYVSNCGFGHRGPYSAFKTWGPIVQACCGLTFTLGAARHAARRAGATRTWTTTAATSWPSRSSPRSIHRNRTGEGQWVDMCVHRRRRVAARPRRARLHGQRAAHPPRRVPVPHAQRLARDGAAQHLPGRSATTSGSRSRAATTDDWHALVGVIGATADGAWARDARFATLAGRLEHQDELDERIDRVVRAARQVRDAGRAPRGRRAGRRGAAPRRAHRRRSRHHRVGPVAVGRPPRDGPGARRRASRAPLGDRLGASSAPRRCSASTTTYVFGEILGLTGRRDRRPPHGGSDLVSAVPDRTCTEHRAAGRSRPTGPGRSPGCGWSSWRASTPRSAAGCSPTTAPR